MKIDSTLKLVSHYNDILFFFLKKNFFSCFFYLLWLLYVSQYVCLETDKTIIISFPLYIISFPFLVFLKNLMFALFVLIAICISGSSENYNHKYSMHCHLCRGRRNVSSSKSLNFSILPKNPHHYDYSVNFDFFYRDIFKG